MVTVIVILLYFFIIIFDFLPILKERAKKQIFVYGLFLTASFCVLILFTFGVRCPGPTNEITAVVEKIFFPSK
jgi:uncharacterized BrkB/YihY/UPF0761 family membrane protein